jgi:hypothetical protein
MVPLSEDVEKERPRNGERIPTPGDAPALVIGRAALNVEIK